MPESKNLSPEILRHISHTLTVPLSGLVAVIEVLDGGGTVPFIARYRKETTGNLDEVQAERLMRERGLSRSQAEARMQAQASRQERLAIATIVVDNSGSLAELDREVGELWTELRRHWREAAE